jgi:hypothetical protein
MREGNWYPKIAYQSKNLSIGRRKNIGVSKKGLFPFERWGNTLFFDYAVKNNQKDSRRALRKAG